MLINRLNHTLFHDTAWVWTVNTSLSFEPIIKYLFGCKGTNFSTKLQIFFAFFFCLGDQCGSGDGSFVRAQRDF